MRQGVSLATGAADSTTRLWSDTGALLQTLGGHTDRWPAGLSSSLLRGRGPWAALCAGGRPWHGRRLWTTLASIQAHTP